MLEQLETNYLETQLRKAEQETAAKNWRQAREHYHQAYGEALWLCDNFINNGDEGLAQDAYQRLKTVVEAYLRHLKRSSESRRVKSKVQNTQRRMNLEFGCT